MQAKSFIEIAGRKGSQLNNSFFSPRKELTQPFFVQPKLSIGPTDDVYEKEADAVADEIVHTGTDDQIKSKISPVSIQRKCAACEEEEKLQRKENEKVAEQSEAPAIVSDALASGGSSLDSDSRLFMESRFGYDFSNVKIHTDSTAAKSAQSINALAYTSGSSIVFNTGQYSPNTDSGKRLLSHELTHVVQQNGASMKNIQRREAPYIKKVTVHLTPPQSAELEWEGTPPTDAVGKDSFTVSTGKGYGDPDDPPGTCKRQCCSDPDKQCAPPWNKPDNVGACCTYYGDNYWTGTPEAEHGGPGGWKWWTPVQPYYSSRFIALHQHTEVTGQPIGHGCVRMDDANAQRIHDFSNGRKTNVTIDGRAAPVLCKDERKCGAGKSGQLDSPSSGDALGAIIEESQQTPIEG